MAFADQRRDRRVGAEGGAGWLAFLHDHSRRHPGTAAQRPARAAARFGSQARGDWDGFSDVDLLAIASTQAQASHLAEALLSAGLADDVIALSEARWRELQASGDPYWAAIGRP